MTVLNKTDLRPVMVYRQLAIEVEAFDRLKSWQRHILARTGQQLTNSQVLNFMLKKYPAPESTN